MSENIKSVIYPSKPITAFTTAFRTLQHLLLHSEHLLLHSWFSLFSFGVSLCLLVFFLFFCIIFAFRTCWGSFTTWFSFGVALCLFFFLAHAPSWGPHADYSIPVFFFVATELVVGDRLLLHSHWARPLLRTLP